MKKKDKHLITEYTDYTKEMERQRYLTRIEMASKQPVKSNRDLIEADMRQLAETSDWDLDGHFHQFYFEDGVKRYFDGWDGSNIDIDYKTRIRNSKR